MPGWEGDPPAETGVLFTETFEADDPPRRYKQRVQQLGKRRKRYTGARRTAHGLWALLIAVGGAALAVILAAVGLLNAGAPRRGLLIAAAALAGAAALVALLLWAEVRRPKTAPVPALEAVA